VLLVQAAPFRATFVARVINGTARVVLVEAGGGTSKFSAPKMNLFFWLRSMKNVEGKTVIWNTQTRGGHASPRWREIAREYWPLPLVGAGLTGVAWAISPTYLAWVSPLLAGLFLAI
jgi:membrane glycosyltransferase